MNEYKRVRQKKVIAPSPTTNGVIQAAMNNDNKNRTEISNSVNKIKRMASEGKRKKDTNQKLDILFDLISAQADLELKNNA